MRMEGENRETVLLFRLRIAERNNYTKKRTIKRKNIAMQMTFCCERARARVCVWLKRGNSGG